MHSEPAELSLRRPAPELLEPYVDFCRETWGHVHDAYILHDPASADVWRRTVFVELSRAERGEGLPPGIVPSVRYWIFAGARCVGVADLRPRLNDALRRYGGHLGLCIRPSDRGRGYARKIMPALFAEAKRYGVGEILLSCVEENVPSARLLETLPGARIERDEVFLCGARRRIIRCRCALN